MYRLRIKLLPKRCFVDESISPLRNSETAPGWLGERSRYIQGATRGECYRSVTDRQQSRDLDWVSFLGFLFDEVERSLHDSYRQTLVDRAASDAGHIRPGNTLTACRNMIDASAYLRRGPVTHYPLVWNPVGNYVSRGKVQ